MLCTKVLVNYCEASFESNICRQYAHMRQIVLTSSLQLAMILILLDGFNLRFTKRVFYKLSTIPFPYLIHMLYDKVRVPSILEVDNRVQFTHMTNIGLIKDGAKPIILHRPQTSIFSSGTHLRDLLCQQSILIGQHRLVILIHAVSRQSLRLLQKVRGLWALQLNFKFYFAPLPSQFLD